MTPISNSFLPESVQAFLQLITYCEGTDRYGKPYNTLFGYETFSDFSKHPNRLVRKNGYSSTAAGRYQILYRTYLSLGGGSFTPLDQDKMAVRLLKRIGSYSYILSGDIEKAIYYARKTWASLPASPYGQPTKSMEASLKVYNEQLAIIQKKNNSTLATMAGALLLLI